MSTQRRSVRPRLLLLALAPAAALAAAACERRPDAGATTAVGRPLAREAVIAPADRLDPTPTRPPPRDPLPPREEVAPEVDDAPPSPPAKPLVLAPPSEELVLPADLGAQLAKLALARLDERRRAAFLAPAAFAAVRGTVVRADEKIVETKDSGWITATAYQVSRLKSWRAALPDLVEVWVRGGRSVGAGEATPDFHQQRRSSEPYFDIGEEVLLSLRAGPLFPGDEIRPRVVAGRNGALTEPAAVEAFAQLLDANFPAK